ncbi:MAG: glycosyl hydrolase [Eubacteriales bacterium]|nr:glycosyl hydrolase [Eubacteriales bacterium]
MLYHKSREPELSKELFQNPTSEYRGTPFWAWNEKLDKEKLIGQISQFQEMGMGGMHIHCRVGLDTEYLGDEFFDCVRGCMDEAASQGLLCYLYDEDRWPSGSAGGIVTREPKYRTRFLVFSPAGYEETQEQTYMAAAKAVRSKNRTSLGFYRVVLDEEGFLKDYKRQREGDTEGPGTLWEAYLEISGDTPWFNDQAYVNTLDPRAVREFINVTHEKYYEKFGERFGMEIKTIFTDEPQTTLKGMLASPFDKTPVITPYTDDFDQTFRKEYGYSLLDYLPELFWERADKRNYSVRYHYHRHVTERFANAFGDQTGQWCSDHGIGLTGHMLNEWTLYSQTLGIGEAMRPMKEFAVPGVDMLCDRREYSTLKQAQSIARQCGREGVMCEIYGVTGWDFDFRNHKLAGDWQAALGVTLRVPHLTWVSMEGEAKRDYPASIGRQSPWYKEYPAVENHFARLNTAMTRGEPVVRIGVIHPIESYWMCWGNKVQTSLTRQVLEDDFDQVIQWLLFGLLDFDFISEAVLEEDVSVQDGTTFKMGAMEYDAVVIPDCITLRSSTLDKLEVFRKNGGKVIFMGEAAEFVDAVPSPRVKVLAENCVSIPFNRGRLLDELEPYRDVDVKVAHLEGVDAARMTHREQGSRSDNLFYQLRKDGDCRWLFLCHVKKPDNEHIAYTERWEIRMKGHCKCTCYDTVTGEIFELRTEYRNGCTYILHDTSVHGSLLLKLEEETMDRKEGREAKFIPLGEGRVLPQPRAYTLEEENVMLLDQAEYAFDQGQWQEREEILRIDNLFREQLGYPLRMEALAQPWTQKKEKTHRHMLKLRFHIMSEIKVEGAYLAMEHPEAADIFWNNVQIPGDTVGWYVDECIKKVRIPEILQGQNLLEVYIPFGRKTNVEWMYLLGEFGVRIAGRESVLVKMPQKLCYGNFVTQDLAFYAGNLVYESEIHTEAGELILEISHYRGALLQIYVDGEKKGNLFLAPYRINCGRIEEGAHRIQIRLFGNRINAFGAVHNANAAEAWYGPNLWRTTGNKWSYEYQLKETGVLTAPVYWVL